MSNITQESPSVQPRKTMFDAGRLPEEWHRGDRVRVWLFEQDDGPRTGTIREINMGKALVEFDQEPGNSARWRARIALERLRRAN